MKLVHLLRSKDQVRLHCCRFDVSSQTLIPHTPSGSSGGSPAAPERWRYFPSSPGKQTAPGPGRQASTEGHDHVSERGHAGEHGSEVTCLSSIDGDRPSGPFGPGAILMRITRMCFRPRPPCLLQPPVGSARSRARCRPGSPQTCSPPPGSACRSCQSPSLRRQTPVTGLGLRDGPQPLRTRRGRFLPTRFRGTSMTSSVNSRTLRANRTASWF